MQSQSFTIKPNALPQWESRTPPARIVENGFIRASVRRAFRSAHHNIGTINKTRELEVYSGCEAMLGLLGRPNATNAGMNIRLTFILDNSSKAVPMVNPEARTGCSFDASDLFHLCTVCHVLLRAAILHRSCGKTLEPVMDIKPSFSQAGGISQSMSASTASSCVMLPRS